MIKRNKFDISLNDDSAIVTHYVQNVGTKYALPFRNDALLLLNGTDGDDRQGYVAEPNPQYNLFPELLTVKLLWFLLSGVFFHAFSLVEKHIVQALQKLS